MSFANRVRALREARNWNQEDVGNRLNPKVTKAAVASWESGKSQPRMHHARGAAYRGLGGVLSHEVGYRRVEEVGELLKPVPLLGFAHMGEPCDEGSLADEVEVPASIANAHPRGFMVHAQGGCMDNRFPHDALLLVDPDMEPVNGQPVLAETSDYGAVVRNYTRGRSTVMLTADSHSGEYDDILAGPGDEPVVCKGRVVWYMGERDERQ